MMNKKIITLMALFLTLTSCGSKKNNDNGQNKTDWNAEEKKYMDDYAYSEYIPYFSFLENVEFSYSSEMDTLTLSGVSITEENYYAFTNALKDLGYIEKERLYYSIYYTTVNTENGIRYLYVDPYCFNSDDVENITSGNFYIDIYDPYVYSWDEVKSVIEEYNALVHDKSVIFSEIPEFKSTHYAISNAEDLAFFYLFEGNDNIDFEVYDVSQDDVNNYIELLTNNGFIYVDETYYGNGVALEYQYYEEYEFCSIDINFVDVVINSNATYEDCEDYYNIDLPELPDAAFNGTEYQDIYDGIYYFEFIASCDENSGTNYESAYKSALDDLGYISYNDEEYTVEECGYFYVNITGEIYITFYYDNEDSYFIIEILEYSSDFESDIYVCYEVDFYPTNFNDNQEIEEFANYLSLEVSDFLYDEENERYYVYLDDYFDDGLDLSISIANFFNDYLSDYYDLDDGPTLDEDEYGEYYYLSCSDNDGNFVDIFAWLEGYSEEEYYYGDLKSPLSVSEALNLLQEQCVSDGDFTLEALYVKGEIIDSGEDNGTYYKNVEISDGENELLIYTANVNNEINIDTLKVGDEITIYGYGKNYQETYELATYNGQYVNIVEYKANESDITPTSIEISKSNASIKQGETLQLNANLLPNGATGDIEWAVSGNNGVSVDQTGLVSVNSDALIDSTALITAQCGDLFINCTITILTKDYNSVTVNKSAFEMVTLSNTAISTDKSINKASSFMLDEVITITPNATKLDGTNNGSFWGDEENCEFRIYQSEGGSLTISAISGYEIESVTITFTSKKNGILTNGNNTLISEKEYEVNDTELTLTVDNSGTATNGQIKISHISVTYKAI